MTKTYKVIGPTNIEVVVEYDATYANVCWLGETTETINDCETKTTLEKYCQLVTFDPVGKCVKNPENVTGTTTWQEIPLTYKIKRRTYPCDDDCSTPPTPEGCACGDVWVENKDNKVTIFYEKYHIQDNKAVKTVSSITYDVSCDDKEHVISETDECCSLYYKYSCSKPCENTTYYNILNAISQPVTISYEGGKVSYTIIYEKVEEHEDCSTKRTRKTIGGGKLIPKCTNSETINCCKDHDVEVISVTIPELRDRIGDENAVIKYNGVTLVDEDEISISVLQKGNKGPECDSYCEYNDTYCVLEGEEVIESKVPGIEPKRIKHEIKVEYETYWGSNEWLTEEQGGKIPPYGGRVRISFDYKLHKTPVDGSSKICKEKIINGKDKVIARVGDCFSSDGSLRTECNDCNKLDWNPISPLPDEGSLTGEILYKERWCPDLEHSQCCQTTAHVTGIVIYDPDKDKNVFMNKITYTVNQDCEGECASGEYKAYHVKTVNADACTTYVSGKVGYTKLTVTKIAHIGEAPVTKSGEFFVCEIEGTTYDVYCIRYGSESKAMEESELTKEAYIKVDGAKINLEIECNTTVEEVSDENGDEFSAGISANQTGQERTIDVDHFHVIQKAGPCDKGTCNGCDDLKFTRDGGEARCDTLEYHYEPLRITCKPYYGPATIYYVGSCHGIEKSRTSETINLTVPCNTDSGELTYQYEALHGFVKVIQEGNPNCVCEEPTPIGCVNPVNDDTLNTYLAEFTGYVGTNITTTLTPCTYTYLKAGYDYIVSKGVNATGITWFIANMLSELTPTPDKVTNYFTKAKEWGNLPDLKTLDVAGERVYQDRIDSAGIYANFKHDTYIIYKDVVVRSRTELNSRLNETSFSYLKTLRDSPATYYTVYPQYVPEAYDRYIPKAPSQTGTAGGDEAITTYDGGIMSTINSTYVDPEDLENYEYHLVPLYDKRTKECYARTILSVDLGNETCNDNFEKFIKNCKEVEYLTSNLAKGRVSRWRPGSCTVGGTNITYLCDQYSDTKESAYARNVCPGEAATTCADQQSEFVNGRTSYPSGHASLGYTIGLLGTLLYGNKACTVNDTWPGAQTREMTILERGLLYGKHRYVAKAHWPTDVLMGQVNASACIGYLLGFKEFDTYFDTLYPECNGDTPTPTECDENCECSHSRFGGGGDAWNRDSSGSGNGFAPKTGFTGSIKIGQWKPYGWTADNPGECYPSQCPEFDVLPVLLYKDPNGNNRTISNDEAQENVEYVKGILRTVQLSLNEDENASDTANPDDINTRKPYGHPEWWNPYFIVMSNLPENNTGHDVYVHIVAKCGKYDSGGKQSKFNFSQLGQ